LEKSQLQKAGIVGRVIERSITDKGDTILKVEAYATIFINELVQISPFLIVNVKYAKYTQLTDDILEEYRGALKDIIDQLPNSSKKTTLNSLLNNEKDFNFMLNAIMYVVDCEDKQTFIKTENSDERFKLTYAAINLECKKIDILREIESKVEKKISKSQREYILREQLKVITEELGDDDKEYKKLKEQIDNIIASDEVKEKLNTELERLNRMSVMSPEFGMLRNYFDWAISLPWGKYTQDNYDLQNVRKTLDDDHYGLEKVKERIVEYMAVKKITDGKNKAPILCFVGPPGVGKTSIAQSIAKAIGKEYLHLSLGGIKDEAEIRGHRKTYIGSMPGRIITSLAKAKSSNPLFLLDEIDKLTSDMRGDPSSALLEVLDPNQNNIFRDNYLEVPFDLSQVMFIMTANSLASIQKPLLDRMEVIEIGGYTVEEKFEIATRYLVDKQKKQNGLDKCEVTFEPSAINSLIDNYTKEAGVRELERQIENVCRKIATKIVDGQNFEYIITADNLGDYLGVKKYIVGEDVVNDTVGSVNGLAWTSVGGVLMPIEVKLLPNGKGDIILTGSLGDVMKESAKIAFSLIKSMAEKYNLPDELWTKYDVHINVPEGATPKDGPSAGVTLTTAILSSLTNKKVVNDLAMTGEITLRGKVLAIGGLKEKTLAGLRNGIKTIIIPKQNQKEISELPHSVTENINLVVADNIQ
ncbi:MAG: endopeptidase La, partial [Clostridia bacterium]